MFARELHEEEKNVYKHHTIPTDMPIERKKPQITLPAERLAFGRVVEDLFRSHYVPLFSKSSSSQPPMTAIITKKQNRALL